MNKNLVRKNVSSVRRQAENINWYLRSAGFANHFVGGERAPVTTEERIEALTKARDQALYMASNAATVAGMVVAYCDDQIAHLQEEQT